MEENELKSEDRDQVILHIIEQDRKRLNHANSHLGDLSVRPKTVSYWSEQKESRNTRGYEYWSEFKRSLLSNESVSFVMAPAWGVIFPPYNLARLTGLLKHYGYTVHNHDINVAAYHYLKDTYDVDYWDSQNYFKWEQPVYREEVHPILKPMLDDYIQKILADETNFIGFSLYLTNLLPTLYMIERIKQLSPEKVIIVGGPEAFNTWFDDLVHNTHGLPRGLIDYVIRGEGEQELLTLLENYNVMPKSDDVTYLGGLKSSLDLNQLPFPDYDDFDLNLYQHSDGVSIETSRGCVAKCTFCAETHFWRYRWRESNRVLDEMKYQVNKYGINRFWFVDSLANGNFKEFKNLVEELVESELDIRWNSYARCDGRMDASLFKSIADSGCISLSFGVESGSEKVLTDMKKNIKVWEIEDNLRDAHVAGVSSHVNWVVGFPTEGPQEWMHSLHVLHNTRKWIYAISPGMTCGDAAFSDLNLNWQKYDMQWKEKPWDNTFMSNWFTKDYKNTIIHRFIRLKFMNIWLRLSQDYAGATLFNGQNRKNITDFYTFEKLSDAPATNYVAQQQNKNLDYFKPAENNNIEFLKSGLANEYLVIPWIMYQVYGPFKFSMTTDPEQDLAEFGGFIGSHYYSKFECSVDEHGKMELYLKHKFEHKTAREDPAVKYHEIVREDMSFDWEEYNINCDISFFGEVNERN
jgi:anaerobic magnesium-protoporphyrin IX monomethyl ester cyclase